MMNLDKYEGDAPFVTCIDHTVSRETFDLFKVKDMDLLVTSPQPNTVDLPRYYQSDSYISHTDSKQTLFDKVYQMVRSYALKNKVKLVEKNAAQKGSLLDIGCGTGDFLLTAQDKGWKISGVEPNENARERAVEKLKKDTDLFNDIQGLVDGNKKFDVITLWHVLEHVPNLEQYIQSLHRLLNDDGLLIVAVPNFRSFDAKLYGEHWAAYDVPRHLWHFSKDAIAQLFGRYDFLLTDQMPMYFDAFYVSLLSEKYKSGSMNPIKAFVNGCRSNWKAKQTGDYSSLIYLLKKA